jgi:hypothetical protein
MQALETRAQHVLEVIDALRAMRGQTLRSELYVLDGTDRQDRPYTVTESLPRVREESPPGGDVPRKRIFFAFGLGQRTTQWERGADPMTKFTFDAEPDEYGLATRQLTVAVPRRRDPRQSLTAPAEPYLATTATTEYARRDDTERYLVDRVARTTAYEVRNDGTPSVFELRDAVLAGSAFAGPSLDGIGALRVIDARNRHAALKRAGTILARAIPAKVRAALSSVPLRLTGACRRRLRPGRRCEPAPPRDGSGSASDPVARCPSGGGRWC